MFIPKLLTVEKNVNITDRSRSPPNMIVQLLLTVPPGEQPYKNSAKDSAGSSLNIKMKVYDSFVFFFFVGLIKKIKKIMYFKLKFF